jgi:hypothetical protein
MIRVASIYNLLFMCHQMTLFIFHIHAERTDNECDLEVILKRPRVIGKDC